MGVFIEASKDKLTGASVLRIESCHVFTTMDTAGDDGEESFLAKVKRFHHFVLEREGAAVLALIALLNTADDGNPTLDEEGFQDVRGFGHFLLGRDADGSEILLEGGRRLLLSRGGLLLGGRSCLGGGTDDDGGKGGKGEERHDDDKQSGIVRAKD